MYIIVWKSINTQKELMLIDNEVFGRHILNVCAF